jgi:hypothetical protein
MLHHQVTAPTKVPDISPLEDSTRTSPITTTNNFRCIGHGYCGSVWAAEGPDDARRAIKREDGGPGRSVRNDFEMHLSILRMPQPTTFSIPECYQLVEASDTEWFASRAGRFPSNLSACRSLITERIPAFPKDVRDRIVDLFCPQPLRATIKANPPDADCLVRLYLGRRRWARTSSRFFSLRNYPLHIDQVESLQLDPTGYAQVMAEALAMMHWIAHVDANDVEFVLAPPRSDHGSQVVFESKVLGSHVIWILDFDCCRNMSMDTAGLEQACTAFFKNDPFFPRPSSGNSADEALWVEFRKHFLEKSHEILGYDGACSHLPGSLITMVEEHGAALRQTKEAIKAQS